MYIDSYNPSVIISMMNINRMGNDREGMTVVDNGVIIMVGALNEYG
jgi:hypothetical protein